jgi:hypothetical protein
MKAFFDFVKHTSHLLFTLLSIHSGNYYAGEIRSTSNGLINEIPLRIIKKTQEMIRKPLYTLYSKLLEKEENSVYLQSTHP